jgi:membrane-associated phospholipid phosphatase
MPRFSLATTDGIGRTGPTSAATVVAASVLIVAAALAGTPRRAIGQALGPERRDIGDLRGDIWSVWSSPARADARDILPLAGMMAATDGTARFADSAVYAWMTTHPNAFVMRLLGPTRENWKLPLYEFGSGQYLLPLAGTLYTAGRLSKDASLRDAGLGCAAGHLSSAGLREVIYLSVSRPRPRVSPTDPDEFSFPGRKSWDDHSFLSGHIANSMACAAFLSYRFHLGAAEPLMFAYVAAIGFGRVADGRHWASDMLAGAFLGIAIGKALADRQAAREAGRVAEAALPAPAALERRRVPITLWSWAF